MNTCRKPIHRFQSPLVGLLLFISATMPVRAQRLSPDVKPFRINISADAIRDLKQRLGATRWPDEVAGSNWNYGTSRVYLQELTRYWQTTFDWKKQEERLNRIHQYVVSVDGQPIHFLYERGKGKRSMPVVLLHGWPSSFVQMLSIIPLLIQADAEGRSFDVIVPSLIGYGFSPGAPKPGMTVERQRWPD